MSIIDCGRHEASEAHCKIATAEPGHVRHDIQPTCAGLTFPQCERPNRRDAHNIVALAEPGRCDADAQMWAAGLTLSECGRQRACETQPCFATACERHCRRETQANGALAEPGQPGREAQTTFAGLTLSTMEDLT